MFESNNVANEKSKFFFICSQKENYLRQGHTARKSDLVIFINDFMKKK